MGKRNEKDINTLMKIVDTEIVKNCGSGFKVELNPLVYSVSYYESVYKFLSKELTWKLVGGSIPDDCPGYLKSSYPDSSYVPQEFLPHGIICEKLPREDLKDGRIRHSPLTKVGICATCIVGQRVFLSVSDEYASKYFKEKYTDIGYPFRDKLLSTRSDLLTKIVQSLTDRTKYCDLHFIVTNEDIRYNTKYHSNKISFEKLSMLPLNSNGQLYGMALALIEKIKKDVPEFKDYLVTVRSELIDYPYGIKVEYTKAPEPPKVLGEW